MNRPKSHALFERAKQLMPGGVNSPARAFGGVGGEPIIVERGAGPYIWDADGNRYIDYVGSWGPLILGHAYPAVLTAVEAATRRGTSFGAPTASENELAELIVAVRQGENRLATAEDLSEEELEELHEQYRQRAEQALCHLNRRRDDKSEG